MPTPLSSLDAKFSFLMDILLPTVSCRCLLTSLECPFYRALPLGGSLLAHANYTTPTTKQLRQSPWALCILSGCVWSFGFVATCLLFFFSFLYLFFLSLCFELSRDRETIRELVRNES